MAFQRLCDRGRQWQRLDLLPFGPSEEAFGFGFAVLDDIAAADAPDALGDCGRQ
jgi:hypothetical protein